MVVGGRLKNGLIESNMLIYGKLRTLLIKNQHDFSKMMCELCIKKRVSRIFWSHNEKLNKILAYYDSSSILSFSQLNNDRSLRKVKMVARIYFEAVICALSLSK